MTIESINVVNFKVWLVQALHAQVPSAQWGISYIRWAAPRHGLCTLCCLCSPPRSRLQSGMTQWVSALPQTVRLVGCIDVQSIRAQRRRNADLC